MTRVNLGPKVSIQAAAFLEDTFKSRNAGAEYLIEASFLLYRKTLLELKGQFSAKELSLLILELENRSLHPLLPGQQLVEQVKDAVLLGGKLGIEKSSIVKIDEMEFLDRLDELSIFQKTCLEIWAKSFWHWFEKEKKSKEQNLMSQKRVMEDFVQQLVK